MNTRIFGLFFGKYPLFTQLNMNKDSPENSVSGDLETAFYEHYVGAITQQILNPYDFYTFDMHLVAPRSVLEKWSEQIIGKWYL
jgi:hypothetical protein